ncbi:MHO_1580 family protein [Metamycoplasma spumans]|uniref:MHO_1580 family protein n=1 Tax=Metamycoplasma spumans TaxID=92406 RepID=UPI0034DD273E
MIVNNAHENTAIINKLENSYIESISPTLKKIKYKKYDSGFWVPNAIEEDVSNELLDNKPIEIKIVRDLTTNNLNIKIKIHESLYSYQKYKTIKINGKDLDLSISSKDEEYITFYVNNYQNGSAIDYKSLDNLEIISFSKHRNYIKYYVGFILDFNKSANYIDADRENNGLNYKWNSFVYKSLSFKITGMSFKENVAQSPASFLYEAHETKINFNRPEVNKPWYHIATSETKISTNNPTGEIEKYSDLLSKPLLKILNFENDFRYKSLNLTSELNKINDNHILYNYYITDKYKYNKVDHQFIKDSTDENIKAGFRVPTHFKGLIKASIDVEQKDTHKINTISIREDIVKPFFDKNDGLIKMRIDYSKITNDISFSDKQWNTFQIKK